MSLRLKKRGEKALEKALGGAGLRHDEHAGNTKAKWKGHPEEETIEESEEPPPSAIRSDASSSRRQSHRREYAETERGSS